MEHDDQLTQWVEDYAERLVRIANTYVQDWKTAEDLVQDAFVKAYQNLHRFDQTRQPFPWLTQIVINECRMRARKSWREIISAIIPAKSVWSSEETYLAQENQKEIHDAVLLLPELFRTPIILFYFEDLAIEDIAQILQINKGTVKSRLSRGRERLKGLLGGVKGDRKAIEGVKKIL